MIFKPFSAFCKVARRFSKILIFFYDFSLDFIEESSNKFSKVHGCHIVVF